MTNITHELRDRGDTLSHRAANLIDSLIEVQLSLMTKISKEKSEYTDQGTPAEHCSNCAHYLNPTTCEVVVGRIRPEGWCNQWRKK